MCIRDSGYTTLQDSIAEAASSSEKVAVAAGAPPGLASRPPIVSPSTNAGASDPTAPLPSSGLNLLGPGTAPPLPLELRGRPRTTDLVAGLLLPPAQDHQRHADVPVRHEPIPRRRLNTRITPGTAPLPREYDGPMETGDASQYADQTVAAFADVPRPDPGPGTA